MILLFEPDEDKEFALKRLRDHLELYFEGVDDPLNCEPACRVSKIEENPSCDKCVNRFIDYMVDSMRKKEKLTF